MRKTSKMFSKVQIVYKFKKYKKNPIIIFEIKEISYGTEENYKPNVVLIYIK